MFQMQARSSSSGELVTWTTSTPDWAGDEFPGPGTAQHVAVAQVDASAQASRHKTTSDETLRVRRYPVRDGDVHSLRAIVSVFSSDGSGAVRAEWEVKAMHSRIAGTLGEDYAPVVTEIFSDGTPDPAEPPTVTMNGDTDVDLNVVGLEDVGLTWKVSDFTL